MNVDLTNIKAEVLLNYLYPERSDSWIAEYKGAFFRNYQNDLMDIDLENNKLSLSRDNFIKLFPESALFRKDVINRKERRHHKSKQLKEDRDNYEDLCGVFSAVDTFRFREALGYEAFFSSLNENKVVILLKEIYGYDYAKEQNKYVKKIAHLILRGDKIKGDMEAIREFLEFLLSEELICKVEKKIGEYRGNGRVGCFLSQVTYYVIISGLEKNTYKQLKQELLPLFDFIKEWFVPVYIETNFIIVDNRDNDTISTRSLLGYNTKIQQKTNNL